MRVISWNINSVRLRAPLVEKLIAEAKPDVICLQETKCPNDSFPEKTFHKLGYSHIAKNGIKGYHGVATLSRLPIVETNIVTYCARADGRHIETVFDTTNGPLHIHNFYVPAGGDEPDPKINEKFAHKLAFLDEMESNFRAIRRQKKAKRQILVGDLNIAPGEHDVWSSKQLKNVVSHTAVEIAALARVQASLNWEDVSRHFVPASEKLYSWWSYRARDWAASDRGRRLDHIWVTPALLNDVTGFEILRARAAGSGLPTMHR